MRTFVRGLGHFLGVRLWEEDLRRRGGWRGFLLRELRILVVVVQSVSRGQIPLRAAAMTLATLLALIPCIVLAFTLIGSFGGFEGLEIQLKRFLIENLVTAVQAQVTRFLETFLRGVHSGAFQGISLFFLLGAVLGLLATVEDAFNHIWGIKRGRSLAHRLTTYTTIAIFAPFLIGISLTATVSMQNAGIFVRLKEVAHMGDVLGWVFGFLPVLVTVLGLTVLYMIMPNTRVSFTSAFPSALTAGVIWELSKWGYGTYLSSRTMYSSLYGSLTAIPLLFLWIQLSWVIVLGGALLTFAREAADEFQAEESAMTASFQARLRAAMRCLVAIARAHHRGERAPDVSQIAAELHTPVRLVRATVGDLLAGRLVHEVVRRQSKGEGGLVPARDLQTLTVYDVIRCLRDAGTSAASGPADPATREVDRILGEIDRNLESLGRPLDMLQIVQHLESAPGARPAGRAVELVPPPGR
jgi:membrane protein